MQERVYSSYNPLRYAVVAATEDDHFWFRARARLVVWALRRYFPRARTFFEDGCGTGGMLRRVHEACPQMRLFGSDIFPEGLEIAARRVPQATLRCKADDPPPFDEPFDVVGAFDVLEHVDDDVAVLRQWRAAARPEGGVMLTVPQHPFLWSAADVTACHRRRYARSELLDKLRRAALAPVRVTSFASLLLPLLAASRLRPGGARQTELDLSPWLHRALGPVMALECALIRAGLDFPCGGSLLVVARSVASA